MTYSEHRHTMEWIGVDEPLDDRRVRGVTKADLMPIPGAEQLTIGSGVMLNTERCEACIKEAGNRSCAEKERSETQWH